MKKYLFYGSSIFIGRGFEYFVLILAPLVLSKEDYGSLEFYKKIIELGTAFFSFGLPTLILTYPKSQESKKYFTLLSVIFITCLITILSLGFLLLKYAILIVPIYFHSVFFNNGVIPPFVLTYKGSNQASIYKSLISILFYSVTVKLILYSENPELTFVNVNYILLPIAFVFGLFFIRNISVSLYKLKRYWQLFRKLIVSSFTIVISNFANMMFLYTDILIIEMLSSNSKVEIADYSFSLNIANALILIPLTLVQVDIEKLKKDYKYTFKLKKRISLLVLTMTVFLIILFLVLTQTYYSNYSNTFTLFCIIICAKIFQALSVVLGAQVLIKKEFNKNLWINVLALSTNITLSYILYNNIELLGIGIASIISLFLRYILLLRLNKKFISKE